MWQRHAKERGKTVKLRRQQSHKTKDIKPTNKCTLCSRAKKKQEGRGGRECRVEEERLLLPAQARSKWPEHAQQLEKNGHQIKETATYIASF